MDTFERTFSRDRITVDSARSIIHLLSNYRLSVKFAV